MNCAQLAIRLINMGILVSNEPNGNWQHWRRDTENWLWDNYQGRFVEPGDKTKPNYILFEDAKLATIFALRYA